MGRNLNSLLTYTTEICTVPLTHVGINKELYCYVCWMCICWFCKWEHYVVFSGEVISTVQKWGFKCSDTVSLWNWSLLLADVPSERFRFYNPSAYISSVLTLYKSPDSSHVWYFVPWLKTVGVFPKSGHTRMLYSSTFYLGVGECVFFIQRVTVKFIKRKQNQFWQIQVIWWWHQFACTFPSL